MHAAFFQNITFFDLINEPHGVSWDICRKGGAGSLPAKDVSILEEDGNQFLRLEADGAGRQIQTGGDKRREVQ